MTKDEALKLALEALEIEEAQTHYPPQWLLKAITAIKEALAQDALDRKAENAKELGLDYEPVAFASHGVVNWIADKQFQHEADLYATSHRKPLTDVEIALIDWESLVSKKDCVRAIEAAHGIAGEKPNAP